MYQEQRLEKILTLLEERGSLSVKEMVDALGVSKDTVRRDFDCLSQRNLAQRTHGGILPVKTPVFFASKNVRKDSQKIRKNGRPGA
jgi:DeoR-like helix-turn-helix domain